MLERSDSARHGMHGAGTKGACEMQAGRGRARVVVLADACGGGQEVRTSCGDQAGQGPGGPSREREKKGRARPCELEGRAVGRAGP